MGDAVNFKLSKFAENLARQFEAKGCVITLTRDMEPKTKFDLGYFNITPTELQDAGCVAIHLAFELDQDGR
jgi:hypothetical protein